jgi:alanyl-tRNA synthetase
MAAAEYYRDLDLPPTIFTGYETVEDEGRILALLSDGDQVRRAAAGEQLEVILDRTPFYAEAGGQVDDTGILEGSHGRFMVQRVRRPIPGLVVHYGYVDQGYLERGETIVSKVDDDRRTDIARNHTATHLLHRALRNVLGEHAAQSGSLVAPDYLRFDFSHLRPMTATEMVEIEKQVNAAIRRDLAVIPRLLSKEEAMQEGAIALFGEKYGDSVRMVSVEESPASFLTRELCGGTHVQRTGEIGSFFILGESSIGAGLRRLEAVTGRGATAWARSQAHRLVEQARMLNVPPVQLEDRIERLLEENKEKERRIVKLQRQLAQAQVSYLLEQTIQVDGVPVLSGRVQLPNMARMREMGDMIRDKLGSVIIVLGSVIEGQPRLVSMVTPDLVSRGYHAGQIMRRVTELVGGTGGGRPEMAQGGGHDVERLNEALAQTPTIVMEQRQVPND